MPLVCYSQTDQVRGINRCQKLRTISDYHFVRTTHVRRGILRWMQDILAENEGKNHWEKAKFLATSPKKKFYYFGVSTIMDFY